VSVVLLFLAAVLLMAAAIPYNYWWQVAGFGLTSFFLNLTRWLGYLAVMVAGLLLLHHFSANSRRRMTMARALMSMGTVVLLILGVLYVFMVVTDYGVYQDFSRTFAIQLIISFEFGLPIYVLGVALAVFSWMKGVLTLER
jgi:hypothetical protein